ncbi:hypothetical protein Acr_07g0014340 [Actinidia rufa]|uniref:Uncharacterized protein n=1 Tax=Actinidia rufa TaxID=165716 RepID=A0A7J0EXU0_9ERIC|nr:hypothetical protein Acr_07g0014340 [Actinidia rufa]
MAAIYTPISLLLLFLSLFSTAEAQQRYSNITLGSSLTPTSTTNSSWLSPSGLYAFGFYQRDNGYYVGVFLAGIPEKTVVWTANRDDPPVPSNVTLAFTDGTLFLQQPQGQNTSIVDLPERAFAASMLESGNFVLYNFDQDIIWQSFEHPTDTIVQGQCLLARKELVSSALETDPSTGTFILVMQGDGNLVQYPLKSITSPDAYFATGTTGDNVTLHLDDDGHLYLLNGSGVNIFNLTQGESTEEVKIYMMKHDADGIFRVYSRTLDKVGNWSTKWESTTDKCRPNGLCGPNGFCVLIDTKTDCRCLPEFEFVNPGKWASGCERNFVTDSCKNTDGVINFTMRPLENTIWQDNSYFVMRELISREDCAQLCLQDCNCEAVFYKEGQCRKQMLPLKNGRRSSDSQVSFIKVGNMPSLVAKQLPTVPPKKEVRFEVLVIGVSLTVFSLILLAISVLLIYKNKVYADKKISEKGNVELDEDIALRSFTFAELEQVTNGFNQECLDWSLGEGEAVLDEWVYDCFEARELDKLLGDEAVDKQNLERMVKHLIIFGH